MIHYVLDGYNIIKSGPDRLLAEGSLQRKREFLLGLLLEFLNSSGELKNITVVFDGPESSPYLSGSSSCSFTGGIKVCFSEGKTADERIEELVLASPKPGDITVVTNDKGIRRLLGGSGAKFMDVEGFARKLFPEKGTINSQAESPLDDTTVEKIDKEFENIWLKQNNKI